MRLLVAFPLFLLASCSPPPAPKKAQKQREPLKPQILQFYVTPNPIPPGEQAQLCWGTEDAVKLELDPPVEQIKPSLARCTEVAPKATTTYAVTATSRDGLKAFAQATLNVDPSAAVRTGGRAVPMLQSVTFSALSVRAGEAVSICIDQRGASSVTLEPGGLAFPKGTHSCLVSTFTRTTTVTITAKGPAGNSDKESATITVR